jgi:hypothetical protein
VCGAFEFDSDQESGFEIASMRKAAPQRSVTFLSSRIGPVPSQTETAEGLLATIIGNEASIAAARRCCAEARQTLTAALDYAAYFVEHTSLKASTICSLYERL